MNFMHVAKTEAGVLQNHFISWRMREPACGQTRRSLGARTQRFPKTSWHNACLTPDMTAMHANRPWLYPMSMGPEHVDALRHGRRIGE
jgi:hypothetical protein